MVVDANQLWLKFYNSGKVGDYLEYVQKAGFDNGADKNQRIDTESTQP